MKSYPLSGLSVHSFPQHRLPLLEEMHKIQSLLIWILNHMKKPFNSGKQLNRHSLM